MNLIIHDLNETEWKEIAADYEGWEVLSGNENVTPCVGCFGCWLKTPGECVLKDGYNHMGELIHKADEVVIMSRYTYGGFSSSVKSILDRSIGYILPFFRMVNGEMHHKPRYPEIKPLRFVFRGTGLTEEDKEKARKYAEAVRTNLNGKITEIRFVECEDKDAKAVRADGVDSVRDNMADKTVFINCSMRGDEANSKKFLDVIADKVSGDTERINIASYVKRLDELCGIVLGAKKVVLGMPLYVDGIPALPLRLMEMVEKECTDGDKKIYVVANMGFFESEQIVNLLSMVKTWCEKCGFKYCGGMAIGAGEMMGQVLKFGSNGPGKFVYDELIRFGEAINSSEAVEDIYTKSNKFPRIAYFLAGNSGMTKSGKSNGLSKKDLMMRIG
ncbi:flavodoxin family protein [Butyrivibrio sp. VCD2006]|uniref:flavodoxin family protein n=1 Tax=Butyrivibrio sp. VCD2006 TaxID=1280664 RepID=UPI000423CE91|nr:flavodoxin family protein [Butyrivibrio sp. VCD2006]